MEQTISVVIPVPPEENAELAIGSLQFIDYPQHLIEIIVAEGRQPSKQRNKAAKEAQGDIIYFLDSDSVAEGRLFRLVSKEYDNPGVAAVGGPSLTPQSDSYLQKAFGLVLGSWFGCFSTRCRFASVGGVREGTERSFILCNFSIRREIFLKENGFNEQLYPNEENELVNRLRARGYRLIYHPEAVVYKSTRPSLKDFARQMFSYGRGRMEHTLVSPFVSNLVYFIPLVFSLYLTSLFILRNLLYTLPFFLYLALSLGNSFLIGLSSRRYSLLFLLPFVYLTEHLAYGIGLACGFLKRILGISRRQGDDIKVFMVKAPNEGSGNTSPALEPQLQKRGGSL